MLPENPGEPERTDLHESNTGPDPSETLVSPLTGEPPPAPVTGSVEAVPSVPGYEILRELGRGGMGVVYHARQTRLGRHVALKMILSGAHAGDADLTRFRTEAEAIARLDHPNIVQIHEIGEHQGLPFFSLEFCGGGSLEKRLKGTPLPVREGAALIETLARAMHAAHQKGVVHRDLKPANVMFLEDGTPKVTDFGLAKKLDEAGQTNTGTVLGTPSYMAPEQAGGRSAQVGPRSDVYALGALLYECLTGRPPFKAATGLDTMLQVVRDDPVSPARLHSGVPRDLETVCLKCLRKDPARRYATALDLADDLHRFQAGEPVQARPVGPVERLLKWGRRRPALAAALASILLASAALTAGALWSAERLRHERDRAESARSLAVASKAVKEQALAEAEAARRQTQAQLLDSQVGLGLFAGEQQKPAQALLWFANAAALAGDDAERERLNRVRCEVWRHVNITPVRAFAAGADGLADLAFDPTEHYLLARTVGGRLSAWDVDGERAVPLPTGTDRVADAAWNADGTWLAVAPTAGEAVDVYRFPSGERLHHLEYPGGAAALAFSPDGHYLALGGAGVRIWDCHTATVLPPDWKVPARPRYLVWNPRGTQVLAAGLDNIARVFAVAGGAAGPAFTARHLLQPQQSFRPTWVGPPLFDPAGRRLLTAEGTNAVACRDADTGRTLWTRPVKSCFSLAVSPDGKSWAVGGYLVAQIFSLDTGRPVSPELPDRHALAALRFTPDSSGLVGVGFDRAGRMWSVPDGKPLPAEMVHQDGIDQLALAPRRGLYATAQFDGLVRVWQPGKPLFAPGPFAGQDGPDAAALSADGARVLPVTRTALTQVHDLDTGRPLGKPLHAAGGLGLFHAAAFLPDGKRVVTGSCPAVIYLTPGRPGTVECWDWQAGRFAFPPVPTPSEPVALACSPDGRRIVAACTRGQVLVLDAATGEVLHRLNHPAARWWYLLPVTVEFSPDGRRFLTAGLGNDVVVWDAEAGRPVLTLETAAGDRSHCTAAHFSPDGRFVVTGTTEKAAQVWDVATGAAAAPPLAHPDWVFAAAFSPDGGRVATAGRDGVARVWDWRKGALTCPVLELRDEAMQLAFTPDGNSLLTVCRDFTCRLWDARRGRPLSPALSPGDAPPPPPGTADLAHCRIQFAAGGRTAVVGSWGVLDLRDLGDPDLLPFDRDGLRTWAELVAGQAVHSGGGVESLTTGQWLERWRGLAPAGRLPLPGAEDRAAEKPPAVTPPAPAAPAAVVVQPAARKRRDASPEQVRAWVAELGGERADAAADALADVGPAALPPLERALAGADGPRRQRLSQLIDRIAVADALAPRPVRLKVTGARAEDALKALADQSGVGVTFQSRPGAEAPTITLDREYASFWEALDGVCRADGLTWFSRYDRPGSLQVSEGQPAEAGRVAYAGPFRVQAQAWHATHLLVPSAPAFRDTFRLQLSIHGLPGTRVSSVRSPRAVEAVTDGGHSLVPEAAAGPTYSYFDRPALQGLYAELPLQAPAAPGGTLKTLKGVLPLDVLAGRRELAVVSGLPAAAGKTFPLRDGGWLTVQRVPQQDQGGTLQVAVAGGAGWTFDPAADSFEVTDAGGRPYRVIITSFLNVPGPRPDDLALFGAAPQAGFPGAAPWAGLALRPARPGVSSWTRVGLALTAEVEGAGPPARLTLVRSRRVAAEVPFEFHDLPLP